MAVLLAGIGLLVWLLPKNHPGVRRVDYETDVAVLRAAAPYHLLVPIGLPASWAANHVRTEVPPVRGRGIASLDLGFYVTTVRQYAALEESNAPADTFVPAVIGSSALVGEVSVRSRRFDVRSDSRHRLSLVYTTADSATVVLTGGAALSTLETLAASLS